jgi:predicted Fe-Mo cluster-binding NifX family protein
MKIAFTSAGMGWDSMIDPRFGRTEFIVLFNEESGELKAVDNSLVKNEAHGAGAATAQIVFDLKPDVLITGNGPGETALSAFKHLNMRIFVDAHNQSLKQAYEQYKLNRLIEI